MNLLIKLPKCRVRSIYLALLAASTLLGQAKTAYALRADMVWFEFRENSFMVKVLYTIPEIKEKRQAEAEFLSKKEAEAFYWALIRGGEFHLPEPGNIVFQDRNVPDPW